MNREGGAQGHSSFGLKLLNTQHSVGRDARKSPIMKWENVFKESSKTYSLKPNAASHNNASWYTDTDGLLQHSPSRGGLCYKGSYLQKMILSWGAPLVKYSIENIVNNFIITMYGAR